jgi:two-component system, NarL family, response regulator DesR
MTVRVLLAEDQAMVRGALSALLSLEDDIEIVAEASRGDEVLPAALDTLPDVALLDIEMPGGDGLEAAAVLHERLPSCLVVILTTFGRSGYLRRAMESGAVGFLLKDAPASELAEAIRGVTKGERVVDPALAAAALSEGDSPLTEREREVLAVSEGGATIEDIAARLYLSEGTVRNYLSTAIKKLGARNRAEAARLAEKKGWLLWGGGRGLPLSALVSTPTGSARQLLSTSAFQLFLFGAGRIPRQSSVVPDAYFSFTYVPGASSMGGYVSLPISGGSTISPEWASSHLLQSSHQEPSCSLACSRHCAEVSKAPPFSVAQ